MDDRGGPANGGEERGVSSVLAIVLLVGVVAVGTVGILVLGGGATTASQDQAQEQRVEQAFLELDRRLDSVAGSKEGRQTFDFDLPDEGDGAVRHDEAGRIVITQTNVTVGTVEELVNRSIGSIVYESEQATFAYQAGAVWRGTGNGTTRLSAPPVSYGLSKEETSPTLTVPITETTGDERLTNGKMDLQKTGTISPLNDIQVVEGELVRVKITSDYYVGWGEYFQTITNEAALEYDHANDTAIVTLVVPALTPPVEGGVIVGASSERLRLKQYATVDSYNSTQGSYSSSNDDQTKVIAAGPVELRQHATIEGNLEAGDDVTFKQDAKVTGNLSYSDDSTLDYHSPGTHVDGWQAPNASVESRTAIDGIIDRNVAIARENNDNATAANVSNGQVVGCDTGPGCWLSNGTYFLDSLQLDSGDVLRLDTSNGSINVVVTGKFHIDNATVDVRGDNRVNVFVDSETGSEDFAMKQDSEIDVPGQKAPQFWIYTDSDGEAKLRQKAEMTGVIYGPGPPGETGTEITMSTTDRIHVYGAVVGDVEPITQEVKVHYDEALSTAKTVVINTAVPRLTFLHVSVNTVAVDDD